MLELNRFARRPFHVDAVQVTEENIDDVAIWCKGDVVTVKSKPNAKGISREQKHIKVRVHLPLNDRQTQAFVGDWVLYTTSGFKVYLANAFDKSFEPVKDGATVLNLPNPGPSPATVKEFADANKS